MKLISLSCNHCGAPLDVPANARFVTCGFCESRLSIQQTGGAWSTEVLEELQQTTKALVSEVSELKIRSDLEQLDRNWEREKQRHLVRNKNGIMETPNTATAAFGTVAMVGFGIFWTVATSSSGAPAFLPVMGVLMIGVAVVSFFTTLRKAGSYQAAHRNYQSERRRLLEQQRQQSATN